MSRRQPRSEEACRFRVGPGPENPARNPMIRVVVAESEELLQN